MAKLQQRITAKQEQADKVAATVTFFEEKVDGQDSLIRESEEAFRKVESALTKILENAGRLVTVLTHTCDEAEKKFLSANAGSSSIGAR